jgi:hypothetical protein
MHLLQKFERAGILMLPLPAATEENILVVRDSRAPRTIPSSFQLPVEMLLQFVIFYNP